MKLYNDYFDEYIHLFPSCNDYLNLAKYKYLKSKMENHLDLNHIKLQKQLFKKYLNKLKEKSNYKIYDKVLMYNLKENLESYRYNYNLTPINHQENFIAGILEMANGESSFIFENKKDYSIFIEKISKFNEMILSVIKNMDKGIQKKYTLPKIITIKLIEQLKELLKTKTYINKNIKYKLDFDFNNACEDIFILPIKKLINFLEKDYLPYSRKSIGMYDLPNGKNEYEFLVKCSTTLPNLSVNEIHEYGLSEVNRINNEMIKIKEKLNFKGTLKEFNKYLRKRDDLNYKSKKELLDLYKKTLNRINNTVIKHQFYSNVNGKCDIVPVPKYNEDFSAEAYYMVGDIEKKRNGKFYINLKNIKDNSKMELESLTLHEANPGHHYQLTYVIENSNIPLFLKCGNNDAYEEGWALYCENLGDYKTLESYYGKLIMEMVRALRLVVDTGIHYYGWSFEKTFKYYKNYSFDSDKQIKNQILRYIAIPTQALSYKIGERIILNLRDQFKGNIKDFHKKILEHGSIPLYLLIELFSN